MKALRKRPSRVAQSLGRAADHFALPFEVNKGTPLKRAPQSRTTPICTEEPQSAFGTALIALAFSLAAIGGIDYGWNSRKRTYRRCVAGLGEANNGFSQIVRKRMAYR